MIFAYYIFAAILILLSYRSLVGGFRYLAFFRKELARPRSEYTPFVTVIAPCRGIDPGMQENLEALFDQDFPEYEIIFVVDDESDPAVEMIDVATAKTALVRTGSGSDRVHVTSTLIVAPKTGTNISLQTLGHNQNQTLSAAPKHKTIVNNQSLHILSTNLQISY